MLANKAKIAAIVLTVAIVSSFTLAARSDEPPRSAVIQELVVRVTDDAKKPVADAEVYFLADMRRIAEGQTDAEGRWIGHVPAETKNWAVFARKSKVGFDYAVATPRRGTRDKLRPLPERVDLKFTGARTLRIKTVDRKGKPISNVKIGPWYIQKPGDEGDINLSGATDLWPKTDKDGVAVLDWLPKRFDHAVPILAYAKDHYLLDHAVPLKADKPAEELTITLLPMEQLSGRVTHADGRPAANIVVEAHGQGAAVNGSRASARTDADGRYSMKVCSEQAFIVAVKDDQ